MGWRGLVEWLVFGVAAPPVVADPRALAVATLPTEVLATATLDATGAVVRTLSSATLTLETL